jgi:transcriptional regulator with XRE-family HTH domain
MSNFFMSAIKPIFSVFKIHELRYSRDTICIEVGIIVEEIRRVLKITQAEAAEASGLSIDYLKVIEDGESEFPPYLELAILQAEYLKIFHRDMNFYSGRDMKDFLAWLEKKIDQLETKQDFIKKALQFPKKYRLISDSFCFHDINEPFLLVEMISDLNVLSSFCYSFRQNAQYLLPASSYTGSDLELVLDLEMEPDF